MLVSIELCSSFGTFPAFGGIDEIPALAYADRIEVNDPLARFDSRRVRGLRRSDPFRIRCHQ
jgi:hypothetical protein